MKRAAFSLVELSIVLVILGLLAAGILGGRELINAAEIRKITTRFTNYQTSVFAFKDKYRALPGDMPNATAFWGEADADPDTCRETVGTGTQTCNGSGNGIIGGTLHDDGVDDEFWERFRVWQHLANAGLVNATYTGVAGPGADNDTEVGVNVPDSGINGAGFSLWSPGITNVTGSDHFYDGNYLNIITFGTENMPHGVNQSPALRPEDAWNIDKKIDDARPATGSVTAYKAGGSLCPNCTTTDDASAEYNLTARSVECSLNLKIGM